MLPLRRSEERLPVNGGKDVIVSYVPICRAGEEVRHAEGRREGMRGCRVGNSDNGFDGVSARVRNERVQGEASEVGGRC